MKKGFLLTPVGCSGPAPCCCHSSYRTLCNVENNRDMVREYDGTKEMCLPVSTLPKHQPSQVQCSLSVYRFCAEIEYFLFGREVCKCGTTPLPLHVLLSAICIANHSMWKSTLCHFKWRMSAVRSSSTSWLERHTSWFSVELWLQQNSLTKNKTKK